jgi:ketosteroid isomerase-like protein
MKYVLYIAMVMVFSSSLFSQDVRSIIEENNTRWEQAMIDKDVNTIMGMYADDVYSLPSYTPMMRGKSDLESHYRKEMESGFTFNEVNFNTVEVKQDGNLAVEVGTYEMSMSMPTGEEMNDNGKYITVWERQGNDWKVIMEAWNSDHNPWEKSQNQLQQKQYQE